MRSIRGVKVSKQYVVRNVMKVFKLVDPSRGIYEGHMDLDSQVDTFVADRNCTSFHFIERVCDVIPYSEDYDPKICIPIIKDATGFTSLNWYHFIIGFYEELWISEQEKSLLNIIS